MVILLDDCVVDGLVCFVILDDCGFVLVCDVDCGD